MASLVPFQIDNVLGAALSTFGRCFPAYVSATIVGGLPVLIVQLALTDHPRPNPDDMPILFMILGAGSLTSLLAALMVQAATLADLGGGKVGLWPALIKSLVRFLPILLAQFLLGLMLGFGFILLIVPGTILLLMFCLSAPVMLAERIGPFASYGRSAALTKGNRLRLFGVFLVVVVVMFIVVLIVSLALAFTLDPLPAAVVDYVWQSICSAFLSVLIVICYRSLKAAQVG